MNSVTVDKIFEPDTDTSEVARLPGEEIGADPDGIREVESGEASEPLVAERQASARKAANRSNLPFYAGVGLVALLFAGGYVFLRPTVIHHPLPAAQASRVIPVIPVPTAVAPLAPAASLANVRVPHSPPAVVQKKYVPQPPAVELSELDSLRAGGQLPSPIVAAPQAPGSTAGTAKPALLGLQIPSGTAAPRPGLGASGGPLTAQAPHTPTKPAAVPSALPASPGGPSAAAGLTQKSTSPIAAAFVPNPVTFHPTQAKPVAAAPKTLAPSPTPIVAPVVPSSLAAAQAGTLSAAQQTNLYQLVTQLGALVRNDEIRQAVLAGQVQQLTLLTSGKITDFDRRLSMLEAQTSVSGAVQAASNTVVTAAVAGTPQAPVAAPPAAARTSTQAVALPATQTASPASSPAAPVQYLVQAASPGLAMLGVVGGNGVPLEVQTGDTIPGYGKVLAVIQQGDSWVVQTQSGNIE